MAYCLQYSFHASDRERRKPYPLFTLGEMHFFFHNAADFSGGLGDGGMGGWVDAEFYVSSRPHVMKVHLYSNLLGRRHRDVEFSA